MFLSVAAIFGAQLHCVENHCLLPCSGELVDEDFYFAFRLRVGISDEQDDPTTCRLFLVQNSRVTRVEQAVNLINSGYAVLMG